MDNVQDTINKLYEKTGFMQKYGGSLIITIVILLIYALTMGYLSVITHLRTIKANWVQDRCNPKYIPFAGIVQGKKGSEMLSYSGENFTGCTQEILRNIADDAVAPLQYVSGAITDVFDVVEEGVSDLKSMTGRIRKAVGTEAGSVMSRFLNIMTPIIRTLIVAKNTGNQASGVLTTGVYTLFGSYLTLKSLIGSIIELTIIILIALAAFCILMWIIPFTWPVAATFTAIFVAIAVPFAIMLVVMLKVFNTRPSQPIPATPSSCFAAGTPIKVKGQRESVPIEKLKLGETLADGSVVTSLMTLLGDSQKLYKLKNVLVTGKHKYFDEVFGWINVDQHPDATLMHQITSGPVYCLCTSSKIIRVNDAVFADWDDITSEESQTIQNNCSHMVSDKWDDSCIHSQLESGFDGEIIVELDEGHSLPIKDIKCGHVLRQGELVLGTVVSNGQDVRGIAKYYFDDQSIIAGPNMTLEHPELGLLSSFNMQNMPHTCSKLYHLITDKGSFHIKGYKYLDFENRLNSFVEEKNAKSQTSIANFYL
jgi:hypothetical protein